jgi:NADPH-dependent 2,4-dienoyl-CoA reductase/sulfur reductase-like enzyme
MTDSVLGRVLIVGASAAGLSAARTLRRAGFEGRITLLGEEELPPYKRPPLSKEILIGTADPAVARLRMDPGLDLDLRLGERAVGLDLGAREVVLAGGARAGYDGLVIATGAAPVNPWGDLALDGVLTLRTMSDCLALRDRLGSARRLAVIGAGFVGAEVASVARGFGLDVTVIEMLRTPHATTLGHTVGAVLASVHRDHGTRLRLGVTVTGLAGQDQVRGVRLSGGEVIPADLVVVGIGAAPATGWLTGSGVALAAGVVCDETCAVLDIHGHVIDGVVAAGDVARWPNPLFGTEMRVEHWDNAVTQGRAAALRLLGQAVPYAPVPYFWTDQYESKLQFVGLAHPGNAVTVVEGSLASRSFVAAYGHDGITVGALTMNMPHRTARYRQLVTQRAPFPPARDEAGQPLAASRPGRLPASGPLRKDHPNAGMDRRAAVHLLRPVRGHLARGLCPRGRRAGPPAPGRRRPRAAAVHRAAAPGAGGRGGRRPVPGRVHLHQGPEPGHPVGGGVADREHSPYHHTERTCHRLVRWPPCADA